MLRLNLKSKEVLNDIFSVFVCTLERLTPGLKDGVKGLVCILLLVVLRALVYLVKDRVRRAKRSYKLDWRVRKVLSF